MTKRVAVGMTNWMLRFRERKIEQCEEILVARTEHPSVPTPTYVILVLVIGAATKATG